MEEHQCHCLGNPVVETMVSFSFRKGALIDGGAYDVRVVSELLDAPFLGGDILPSLVETSFISTQTLIVRKDILQLESGFDPEQLALVDWELMLRVSGRGAVAYIDEPLVIQRFSGNSITRSSRRRADARARLALKHRDLFSRFPGTLARHFHAVSGAYRQVGDFGRALEFNHHARKADPTSWRLRTAAIRLSILKMINRADTK